MRAKNRNYLNLWADAKPSGNHQANLNSKHAYDYLESIEVQIRDIEDPAYQTRLLYQKIIEFNDRGFHLSSLKLHTNIFLRLIMGGVELMNKNKRIKDLVFLGAFIDMKIKQKFADISFYKLVLGMLRNITKGKMSLSDKIKTSIQKSYKKYSYEDYKSVFIPALAY